MKQLGLKIALALLIQGVCVFVASSFEKTNVRQANENVVIAIRLKPTTPSTAPRTIPAQISAEYNDVLNSVVATLANAGTSVDVSIENLSTGESYGDTVSGSGMALIPISGTSGVWLLTISLENGDVYEGEFEL